MKKRTPLPRVQSAAPMRAIVRTLAIIGLFAGTVLAGSALIVYQNASEALDAGRAVALAEQINDELAQLMLALHDAQTGELNYAISGKSAVLEPYHNARFRVGLHLTTLRPLVNDDLAQVSSIAQLEPLIAVYLNGLAQVVAARDDHGFDGARHLIEADPQRALADPIAPLIERMHARARLRLSDSLQEEQTAASRALAVTAASLALLSLLSVGFWVVLRREFRARERLELQMVESAISDDLTGALNRREFDRLLEQEWAFRMRYATPLSLLFIKIDNFAEITAQYGHLGGDAVLRETARRLRLRLRATERLARYDGEQFALLVPQPLRAAVDLATQLGAFAAREPYQVAQRSPPVLVNISMVVGVADASDAATANDLVTAADDALYAAGKPETGPITAYQDSMRRAPLAKPESEITLTAHHNPFHRFS